MALLGSQKNTKRLGIHVQLIPPQTRVISTAILNLANTSMARAPSPGGRWRRRTRRPSGCRPGTCPRTAGAACGPHRTIPPMNRHSPHAHSWLHFRPFRQRILNVPCQNGMVWIEDQHLVLGAATLICICAQFGPESPNLQPQHVRRFLVDPASHHHLGICDSFELNEMELGSSGKGVGAVIPKGPSGPGCPRRRCHATPCRSPPGTAAC